MSKFNPQTLKEELNSAQLKAVESIEGPHLIIAGAGSGKTRVLVYRVANLVHKGVNPGEILLLTFTRKAAEEMLRRASLLLDERCTRVAGGTFHSFANMVLRKYGLSINLGSNFSLLDQSDAEDTINLVRTQAGFNKAKNRFPRKNTLLDIISKSVNKSEDIGIIIYDEYSQFIEWVVEIEKIRDEYVKYKLAKSLLDYDDLLVFLKNLLNTRPDIRSHIVKKYKYIMVDEYQDTNRLQAEIIYLLSAEHKNIMVVGDDSQSIYSFRGANFRNILDFPKIFPETKIITLEENYRSTQSILDLTNQVIKRAEEGFEKNLFTKKKSGKFPVFIDAEDENSQSRFIADKILEMREEGVDLSEIAVLFRSGWHSNDLEIELTSRNIPFVKYGGQKFVEAAHIKDVIACLRIVYNSQDAVSWNRILLLMRGIGPKTAEKIINEVLNNKAKIFDSNILKKSSDILSLLELLKKIEISNDSPARILEKFLSFYEPLLKEKYDDFKKRLNDLDSLLRIASRYNSLEKFLTDMALEPPEKSIIEAGISDKSDSHITLSTIHSAKGLEWNTVFIIYVAEGHLPSYLSIENKEKIEEERRLFYVAMTRAKENLFLLKPHIDSSMNTYFKEGNRIFTEVSRFLTEGSIIEDFMTIESAYRKTLGIDGIELEDIFG